MLYGTAWKKEQTTDLVFQALKAGFRGIDTACQPKHYQEHLVGDALRAFFTQMDLRREDVWIQTKFTSTGGQDPNNIPYNPNNSVEAQVQESIGVSLKNLKIDTIDSLLLHSPLKTTQLTLVAWSVMEAAVQDGRVKCLGISNIYDLEELQLIYEKANVKPSVVQNRFYDKTNFDRGIRKFCLSKGIVYQTFWTLSANPHVLRHRDFEAMASKYGLTPAQLLYKFVRDSGHQPLSGCKNARHVAEAVAVGALAFALTKEEMTKIEDMLG